VIKRLTVKDVTAKKATVSKNTANAFNLVSNVQNFANVRAARILLQLHTLMMENIK